jgi:hypothetical protein
MSSELARRIATHLRGGIEAAGVVSWEQGPAVLARYVEAFAAQLETGDSRWVDQDRLSPPTDPFAPRAPRSDERGVRVPDQPDVWAHVDELRRQVASSLVRVEGTPRGDRKVGYFALLFSETTKFYRVTAPIGGKWDGRVFVDAQASDDYHPIKNPTGLARILGLIADDPEGAARRYARELGRCSRCNRTLTDEESRSIGMGPDCRALTAA